MPPTTSMQRPSDPQQAIRLIREVADAYERSEVVRNWGQSTASSTPNQVSIDELVSLNDRLGLGVFALTGFTIAAASQIGQRQASQQRR
jgi:hypothetical protein